MTKDGLKKEASMLDLSADNQDGFDDTDGQLYTSNSLLFFIREIYMKYSAPLLVMSRVQIPLSLLILFAKITRPLMREILNFYGG